MCRNIRALFDFDPPMTEDGIRAASLQLVRKVRVVGSETEAVSDSHPFTSPPNAQRRHRDSRALRERRGVRRAPEARQ